MSALAAARPDAGAEQLGWGLVGLIGLTLVGLAWSGRWRSWTDNQMAFWLITVAPPTCVFLLLYGLTGLRGLVVAIAAALVMLWWLAGWVIFLISPRWYGPAWYRAWRHDLRLDRTTASARVISARVPAGQNSEARARAQRSPATPTARRRVLFVDPALGRPSALHTEGAAAGHLLLYPDELVFVTDQGDDALRPGPTIRALPAAAITAVRPGRGLRLTRGKLRQGELHIDTSAAPAPDSAALHGWTVEPLRRAATLAELRRVYLDGRNPVP